MRTGRRFLLLVLALSFVVLWLPAFAQTVIATVPVGRGPLSAAVNSVTNKIYIADWCGTDTNCTSGGTVTVIDGATDNTSSINVGYSPYAVAVNSVTNKIYVANQCGNDPSCMSGTVSVIDGVSNAVVATVATGSHPYGVTVNSATNQIYVPNNCGDDPSCFTKNGTVTVIDGASNTVVATVPVGAAPNQAVVNSVTNKIYVPNSCGSDPRCNFPYRTAGTVTVIDGATNSTVFVDVGVYPDAVDVNMTTNQIYVANKCGGDPACGSTATITVIDGATLATTDVSIGGHLPFAIAVNSATNKIYVPSDCYGDPSCQRAPNGTVSVVDGVTLAYTSVGAGVSPDSIALNSVTNRIYVANECGSDRTCNSNGTVTVIDGASLAFTNIAVGTHPYGLAVNAATNRIYIPNYYDETVSVMLDIPTAALQFVTVTPCRVVDTRPENGGGGPIQGGTHQEFAIAGAPPCGIPVSAAAYSLNVTVVPNIVLGYLTIWPAGLSRPLVSTLNSLDGRIKADAAIVPAGTDGKVSVYVTDTTNVILDIDGYFAPVSSTTLAFYPLTPCRVGDTRDPNKPSGLGPPHLSTLAARDFPVLSSPCIPTGITPLAYSFNFTAVPYPPGSGDPLGYLELWPKDQMPQSPVSTLNNLKGTVVANAAIVPAGTGGDITAFANNDTDLVIDINGYFAPAGPGGLSLYTVTPCRVIDTRHMGNRQPFIGTLSPPVDVVDSDCGISSLAQAYAFNATVVPVASLGYLTLWPDGADRPVVSTLNAVDGWITNNMAIVPSTNGSVDAYATDLTHLILDISSYFAP